MLGTNTISSFLKTIFFFVLIACFFNTIAASIGFGFPYNTFLFMPEDVFADFFKVMDALAIVDSWSGFNNYGEIGINHMPPFAISVYVWIALLMKSLHLTKFTAFLIVFIVPLIILLSKSSSFSNKSKYWFLILLSYPILIVLTRGNVAVLVFVSLAFFILRIKNLFLSMFFLAVATSIKITPVIFIIYFLVYYSGNWKKIITGLTLFGVFLFLINYLSVIFVSANVSPDIYDPSKLFQSIKKYESLYVDEFGGLRYGSSFYMPFRYVINFLEKRTGLSFFTLVLHIKPLIINLIVLLVLLAAYLWRFSFEKLWALMQDPGVVLRVICCVFVLFTPVTGDYYLTIMILPLFFVPFDHFTLAEKIFYILVLTPKNYLFYHEISMQVFLNPLILLALLITVTGLYQFNFFRQKSAGLKTDLSY